MIETNKDKLLKLAVMGEIVPSGSSGYRPTWNGVPKMSLGMGGIKYNLRVGDLCYGWASGRPLLRLGIRRPRRARGHHQGEGEALPEPVRPGAPCLHRQRG